MNQSTRKTSPSKPLRIYLDSVGCRVNQSEIDRFAHEIAAAGHEVVHLPQQADIAIINTCAVTGSAVKQSRQVSRRAARAGAKQIVLTGCWATLQPKEAAKLLHVTHVSSNQNKESLIETLLGSERGIGSRHLTYAGRVQGAKLRTRAFIKAQDGCDNRCTFCVATLARGKSQSSTIQQLLDQVQAALEQGVKEVVLTGVQLGAWGLDLQPKKHLGDLVQAILNEKPVPRLRLSSLEPWNLTPEFFALWQDSRLCPHLHLPLQSGSATILRRMNRRTDPDGFRNLIRQAREAIPDLAVTTDILVGFPGESEREFRESLWFVRELRFAGGHVFSFSPRPGTRAADYPDQVHPSLIKERNARLREVLAESGESFRRRQIGSEVDVLWEGGAVQVHGGWRINGWSPNRIHVQAFSPTPHRNAVDQVRLVSMIDDGLFGQITTVSSYASPVKDWSVDSAIMDITDKRKNDWTV